MPSEPEDYVIGRVQEALAHDPRVNELDVTVTVTGGGVFLDGTVPTEERRDAITAVARTMVPGVDIHNEVTVATLSEPDGAEELK
jgi:osmotically-inducible protein OsmY